MLTDNEISGILSEVRNRLMNNDDGDLTDIRQENLNYYRGELDGTERPGYSQYVTREVMEAIEWALPSLLRAFTSGDKVVMFDPVGPEDEQQSDQETDIVNHYLLKENNGFLTFYEWFKDALMYPNGYAKIYTEDSETSTSQNYKGLTGPQLAQIDQDEELEIVESSTYTRAIPTPQSIAGVELYDVKVRRTVTEPVLRFESIPPEQVLVDNNLASASLDDAEIVCHRQQRSKSWLLEAGYDEGKLEEAGTESDHEWNTERTNRLWSQDESPDAGEDVDASMAKYWLEEWYIKIDCDEDGIAETRKIDTIGGVVFENIEYDYQPIVSLSSIPMSHKHAGMSLADLIKPIQQLSTFFSRGINDNVARINNPRKYVAEGALSDEGLTLDQLLDINSDAILVKQPGMIEPEQHQPVINELLMARQDLEAQSKVRTGVAPELSLKPEVLQQSTAGAFANALQEASQRIEMIARIFAETGVKDAMIKAHRQVKEYQSVSKAMKIRGQWIESNPSDWMDRRNVSVNVGLGFNNKEKQIGVLMQVLGIQKEGMAIGLADPKKIYNTLEQLVEAAGLKSVDRYFNNPTTTPPQQPQVDPMAQVAQAQVRSLDADIQRKGAETQAKIQMDQMAAQAKAQKDMAELQFKGTKEQVDAQLAREKMQLAAANDAQELELKRASTGAEVKLKGAQTMKTAEEARGQDIENDAVESGIQELVEGGGIEELQARADQAEQKVVSISEAKEGPKDIQITRTETGLEGVITDAEGNERRVVVNSTENGMAGTVEGE